ncbi:MAG: DUF3078 domain-containing protein [Rikenellaceae bacterium]
MSGKIILGVLIVAIVAPMCAMAQMDIDEVQLNDNFMLRFSDSIRLHNNISVNYYSHARHKYERRKLRNERNTLEVTTALQGGVTSLSESWIETSGGDNSVSMLASINAKHTYTKNLFSIQTQFIGKFGYYRINLEETLDDGSIEKTPTWYKNQDEFQLNVTPSIKMTKNWSYAAAIKFRSQFAKGYGAASTQESYNLKSDFMAPGYLDLSVGLIYTCPKEKFPFTVSLSPVAMSATYVTNEEVRANSQYQYLDPSVSSNYSYATVYGVHYLNSSKYEGGSSLQVDFKRSFGKNNFLTYDTTLYTFYGWMTQLAATNSFSDHHEYEAALDEYDASSSAAAPTLTIHPVVRWENEIKIKATKLLSTTLTFQLYYNKAQNLKIQTQTYLLVGLSYTFKNSVK